jgi:hypothetical protein
MMSVSHGGARRARLIRASRVGRRPDARPRTRIRRGYGPDGAKLVSDESILQELEARGATMASVPFSSRAGRGGHIDRIALSRFDGNELVDVER